MAPALLLGSRKATDNSSPVLNRNKYLQPWKPCIGTLSASGKRNECKHKLGHRHQRLLCSNLNSTRPCQHTIDQQSNTPSGSLVGVQWCQDPVPSEQLDLRTVGLRIGILLHCLTRAGGKEGNITAEKRSWEQVSFSMREFCGVFLSVNWRSPVSPRHGKPGKGMRQYLLAI